MPPLSQLMIRTALLHLGIGFTLGALALANKGIPLLPWLWTLRMPHVHLLLAGWMVQLACGVAFWILPRYDAAGSRGDERPFWIGYIALNSAVLLAALHDPLAYLVNQPAIPWLITLAGLSYTIAALTLAPALWGRILPFRAFTR